MVGEDNLAEARATIKRQLADGTYKSSVDVILGTVGRVLQKLTRRHKAPAPWISALVIALLVSLVACLGSLLAGGLSRDAIQTIALGGTLIFLNPILARSAFQRSFDTIRDKLLDGLESSDGLTGVHAWLASAGVLKWPVLLGLCIFPMYVGFIQPNPNHSPVETAVVGGVMLLWTGFLLWYMLLFAVLPVRLSRCQFKLHAEDPVSTEVLVDWSGMMSYAAYMFAFMLATGTLFTVTASPFTQRTLVFIIPRWLPLIALFVVNQVAISGLITRSKRATLNDVEAQMEAMRAEGEPPDHETMETLLWVWDYHDRIRSTRDTAIDIKGILNLVNTLLIPLLAFLWANREAILELTGWGR